MRNKKKLIDELWGEFRKQAESLREKFIKKQRLIEKQFEEREQYKMAIKEKKIKYPIIIRGRCGVFQISIGSWGLLTFEFLKPFKNKVTFSNKDSLIDIKNAFEKAIELMERRKKCHHN